MELFDKKKSLDRIIGIMQMNTNPTISESIDIYTKLQGYLQEIYDCGYVKGFEEAIEATDKVNKL